MEIFYLKKQNMFHALRLSVWFIRDLKQCISTSNDPDVNVNQGRQIKLVNILSQIPSMVCRIQQC